MALFGSKTPPDPLGQFRQKDADHRIASIILKNPSVNEDVDLADALISAGKLDGFAKGDKLMVEGEQDYDVFFILGGEVSIHTDVPNIPSRSAPIQVGEMAAMQPGEARSATVIASSETVATLRVDGQKFRKILADFPDFKDRLSSDVSQRFRQRMKTEKGDKGRNRSWGWTLLSLFSALIASAGIFAIEHSALAALVVGIGTFIFVVRMNPDLLYRNVFWMASSAAIGLIFYGSVSYAFSVDGTPHGIPFLIDFSSGEGMTVSTLAVSIVGLLVLAKISSDKDERINAKK